VAHDTNMRGEPLVLILYEGVLVGVSVIWKKPVSKKGRSQKPCGSPGCELLADHLGLCSRDQLGESESRTIREGCDNK